MLVWDRQSCFVHARVEFASQLAAPARGKETPPRVEEHKATSTDGIASHSHRASPLHTRRGLAGRFESGRFQPPVEVDMAAEWLRNVLTRFCSLLLMPELRRLLLLLLLKLLKPKWASRESTGRLSIPHLSRQMLQVSGISWFNPRAPSPPHSSSSYSFVYIVVESPTGGTSQEGGAHILFTISYLSSKFG